MLFRSFVILLRVLVRENKILNVGSFIILRSGKRITSLIKDNSAKFSSEKKYTEALRVDFFYRTREKSNLVLVVRLVLESIGLCCSMHICRVVERAFIEKVNSRCFC